MIGEMTLADAEDVLGYWRQNPPAHILVAQAIGWKPAGAAGGRTPEAANGNSQLAQLAKQKGGRVSLEMLMSGA